MIYVGPELEAKLVFQFPLAREAGISGLQSGKCLANGPYILLNRARSYLISTRSMTPVIYCLAKALGVGTGYLYKISRGSRDTSWKNADHFSQYPLVAEDLPVEGPLKMLSATAWKLSRKRVRLASSTVAREAL